MPLSCRDAARLLCEKRDHRLSWRTRISLRLHVLACRMCRVYCAQMTVLKHVCQEAGVRAEHECPGELPEDRKQRMKEILRREP